MEANELRIGNYVKDRIHREVTVSEIRPEHLVFHLSNGNKIKHHIKTFEPIPLTSDWLFSFGFRFIGGEYHLTINENWLYLVVEVDNSYALYSSQKAIENGHECCGEYLTYVHQLQNLYFALTGKELKRI